MDIEDADIVEDYKSESENEVADEITKPSTAYPNESKYGNIKNKDVRNQLYRKEKRAKNKVSFYRLYT